MWVLIHTQTFKMLDCRIEGIMNTKMQNKVIGKECVVYKTQSQVDVLPILGLLLEYYSSQWP